MMRNRECSDMQLQPSLPSCSYTPLSTPTPDINVTPQLPTPALCPDPQPYHQPSPPNSSITICMAPLAPDYANYLSSPCSPLNGCIQQSAGSQCSFPWARGVHSHTPQWADSSTLLPSFRFHSPLPTPHLHPKKTLFSANGFTEQWKEQQHKKTLTEILCLQHVHARVQWFKQKYPTHRTNYVLIRVFDQEDMLLPL